MPNVISCSAAISACEKGGEWEQALSLLSSMPGVQVMPIVISCNAAISACEKGDEWKQALSLLSAMDKKHIAPDKSSYRGGSSARRQRTSRAGRLMGCMTALTRTHARLRCRQSGGRRRW